MSPRCPLRRTWHGTCMVKSRPEPGWTPTLEHQEHDMTRTTQTTLGDLISVFYEEFLELYGDAELASVATAAVINDMLIDAREEEPVFEDAA